jgi:hypothetical protein
VSAISQLGVSHNERVARRFRTAPQKVRGSGNFALVFCGHSPRVNLYETRDERNRAWEIYQRQSCGAFGCNRLDHNCIDL